MDIYGRQPSQEGENKENRLNFIRNAKKVHVNYKDWCQTILRLQVDHNEYVFICMNVWKILRVKQYRAS